jgi:hypothetical protein
MRRIDPAGGTTAGAAMLSVIVDTQGAEDRLAGLLAQLTAAAVEGLVKEVLVVDAAHAETIADAIAALCEDTGAQAVGSVADGIARAKSDWLLVLPAAIRFGDGWVERLKDHLAAGPRATAVAGLKPPGLFARRPYGMLVSRAKASGKSSLAALRGQQGADRIRLG